MDYKVTFVAAFVGNNHNICFLRIDFAHDLFVRTWDGYLSFLRVAMALTFLIAMLNLIRQPAVTGKR